jgi:hypothetical protein
MIVAFGPLAMFLCVLVVLLLAKAVGDRPGRLVAVLGCLLACGFAMGFLYLLRSRPAPVNVVFGSEQRIVTPAAGQTAPIAVVAADSSIPVETTLASEQEADPPRPDWVNEDHKLVDDAYFVTAKVGPHATRELCDEAMTEELRRVTERYIDQLIGSPQAGRLVELPLADVRRQVVQAEYQETIQASFGPMVNLYTLLKFDKKMQDRIVLEHEQALVQRRVGMASGGIGLLLVVLGTLFGYLKLDTATRGYYSGRLKLAAAAVILSAVALGALMAHKTGVDTMLVGERGLAATDSRF